MKRVVIYARVSTADQETQNQVAQLTSFAGTQGWQVIETIVDTASGAKGRAERAGLERVFLLAHQRRIDLVLFWALDRFSREGSRQTIAHLSQLEASGVGFHSFTEPYLSTLGIFSDAIIALLSALAKQERIRIGERTRLGLQRVKAEGRRLGRPRTPPEVVQKARNLRATGASFSAIGGILGLSRSRAFQLCQK